MAAPNVSTSIRNDIKRLLTYGILDYKHSKKTKILQNQFRALFRPTNRSTCKHNFPFLSVATKITESYSHLRPSEKDSTPNLLTE